MLSTDCFGNFIWYCIHLLFCIYLAPFSLQYYVARYDVSRVQLQTFLEHLRFPHNLLTLNQYQVTVNTILDNLDEIKQINLVRLQSNRLPVSLLLALDIFAAIFRLTYPGRLTIDSVAGAILMTYGFFIAWRFGSSLRHPK